MDKLLTLVALNSTNEQSFKKTGIGEGQLAEAPSVQFDKCFWLRSCICGIRNFDLSYVGS
eukprot:snap_masked-scaffold_52-processed-gene-0.13-mRNA-1 protein AED:1.00 eAED:1.00 QI:0/0/0/0/1/1/2/0/59